MVLRAVLRKAPQPGDQILIVGSGVIGLLALHVLKQLYPRCRVSIIARHTYQQEKAEIVVVEVSSFQLDTIDTFRPKIAILLNIADDHLDRYPDFAAYGRSKFRIFENQQAKDMAILNGSDPKMRSTAGNIVSRKLFFTGRRDGEEGADITDENIFLNLGSDRVGYDNFGSNGSTQ